jgi:hypothetical protein
VRRWSFFLVAASLRRGRVGGGVVAERALEVSCERREQP